MSSRRVIFFECDNCETVGPSNPDNEFPNALPKKWEEHRIRQNGSEETFHFCGRCVAAIKFALLEVKVFDGT